MKKFGLVIATKIEINVALEEFKNNLTLKEEKPFLIYEVKLNNKILYIINSGIGNTLSSSATTYLINKYKINYIFNYGVVGAVNKNIDLEDIILIDKVFDFGFDTDPIDHKGIGYHEELNKFNLSSDEYLLSLAKSVTSLKSFTLGSSNRFIEKKEEKEKIYNDFKVDVVDMEGFGFIASAKLFNVKCLLIKGVSDSFLDDSSSYLVKASEVAKKTFKYLIKIIENID